MAHQIIRAYRIRFKPTKAQAQVLNRSFGAARWAYNYGREVILHWIRRHQSLSGARCIRLKEPLRLAAPIAKLVRQTKTITYVGISSDITRLKRTAEYAWLKEIPSDVINQSLRNLDRAFANFFAKRAKYPKRKKFGTVNTVRLPIDPRHIGKLANWVAGKLELPLLGTLNLSRALPNTAPPKLATVRLESCGKWSVSFCVQEEGELLPVTSGAIGIDVGVSCAIAKSDGDKVENDRRLTKRMKYLKRQQRRLSRKVKGSNRWKRQKAKIAGAYNKLSGMRRDQTHRQSNRLIAENQIIVTEDLNVSGMMRIGGGLAREISDVAMSGLISKIAYKADWYGRTHIKIGRFFASSKTCSACGYKLDELKLDVRQWTCPKCSTQHDRDINAAKSVLAEGLRLLGATGPLDARGGGSSGEEIFSKPVPANEARTGQADRACREQTREA